MTDSQKQSVAKEGTAIQSGGDTIINSGLSPAQMRQIMETLSDQLPKYAQVAAILVEERLKNFEEKIIARFEADESAQREAFADPDFQHLLLEAQKSFSRSGDGERADQLSELIVERSKAEPDSRKALTINRAIATIPSLTKNEIAELTLAFAVTRVNYNAITDLETLGKTLKIISEPWMDDVALTPPSYEYLESLGCGKISITERSIFGVVSKNYDKVVQNYPAVADVLAAYDVKKFNEVVAMGLLRITNSLEVARDLNDEREFLDAINRGGLDIAEDDGRKLFSLTVPSPIAENEFVSRVETYFSRIGDLVRIWTESPLKNFELSAVGIVIGYTNLMSHTHFRAKLDTWIT